MDLQKEIIIADTNIDKVDNIDKINIDKIETVNIKREVVEPPSILYEVKRSLGLEKYPDSSFLIYVFITIYGIQKLNDLFTFIKNVIVLPKQVAETYNFITKEDIALVDKVDDLMNQLMGLTGADRLLIAKVHNGTYDHTGSHEMKFSVIYEVVDRLPFAKSDIQNIPINYIREEILLGSWDEYQRIERSELDSVCDKYLDRIGIKAKDYKLLAINNIIYGIIDLHYIEVPDFDFSKNKLIERRANKISKEIEACLERILLKRNWFQKLFSKIFKVNSMFK